MDNTHLYAVIMAGGRGERFWPAGRADRPKQLLPLLDEQTMIEKTVRRLFPLIQPEHLLVITNEKYVERIRRILPVPPENIIGEPVGRDTAPCVALAAYLVGERDPDGTMLLLPADHDIRPLEVFQGTLYKAALEAQKGSLVVIGIHPTYPATGYGYIHCGEPLDGEFRKVLQFKEKPELAVAEEFMRSGNYKWNSGMFIWRVDVIAEEFRKHCPALYEKIGQWRNGTDFHSNFQDCLKISIDYAIMEKSDRTVEIDAAFSWNDIGSWSALRTVMEPDPDGNAVRGNAVTLDSTGNVLMSDSGMLIGVIGMKDIAVIQSGNGILVCPLSEEQRVKELVKRISNEHQEYL